MNKRLERLRDAPYSQLPPLPFWPNLKRVLQSHGAALLLIYLEVVYPPPRDLSDRPFLLDPDRTRIDIQVSHSSLVNTAKRFCVWFRSERALRLAQLAGREFFATHHWGVGPLMPYSLLARPEKNWSIRRNNRRLQALCAQAGLAWPLQIPQDDCFRKVVNVDGCGFQVSNEDFRDQNLQLTGRALAREMAESLAVLSDGRRKAGLKRKPHHRAKWTEARRAKFMQTVQTKSVDKRAISDVAMDCGC